MLAQLEGLMVTWDGGLQEDGLAVRLREILEVGRVNTTVLNPRVTNGKALWQAWHHDFSVSLWPSIWSA